MEIAKATPEDYAAIYQLMNNTQGIDNHTAYTLWQCTYFDADFFLVAKEQDTLLGYVFGRPTGADHIFLWQIAVSEAARGKHVGKQLVQQFIKQAQTKGFTQLITTITQGNQASERLFQSIAKELESALVTQGNTGNFGGVMSDEVIYHLTIAKS